ncbi:MAG: hypothetical protein A3F41_05905 [Coxiella sp. RIFCSPHIGHO2_12_FULL_44_14]|nr:MAG: hypothetical protein A3F41_05905 [Coxiella sp. RIFCSPHIGHO2_12_FULL_44_14]
MLSRVLEKLMRQDHRGATVLLGALLIFSASASMLSSDMYVPSLPYIAKYFSVSATQVKLTISVYFLTFSLSQLAYGPLSDAFGRRIVILSGLAFFLIGSLICAYADSIDMLIVGRLVQGIGAGAPVGLSRSIMRDVFTGPQLVRFASYTSLAYGIMPIIAPTLGGYFQHYLGWQSVFVFLMVYSFISWVSIWLLLPETNTQISLLTARPMQILKNYRILLTNREFVGHVIITSLCFSGVIVYYAITPFLLQDVLRLSAVEYGWLTMFITSAVLLGKLLNVYLVKRYSSETILGLGSAFLLWGGASMLLLGLTMPMSVTVLVLPMVFYVFGMGLIASNASAGAMMPFPAIAGTAGSLFSCLQTLGTAFMSVMAAHINARTQIPMAILFTVLGILAVLDYFLLIRKVPGFV